MPVGGRTSWGFPCGNSLPLRSSAVLSRRWTGAGERAARRGSLGGLPPTLDGFCTAAEAPPAGVVLGTRIAASEEARWSRDDFRPSLRHSSAHHMNRQFGSRPRIRHDLQTYRKVIAMRSIPRLLLAIVVLTMFVMVTETPARAAETLLYDVTTFTYTFVGHDAPPGATSGPSWVASNQRIEITDRGALPDGGIRWTSESLGQLFVTEQIVPPSSSPSPYSSPFTSECRNLVDARGLNAQTTSAMGFVDFAWFSGPSGDPYGVFCLKQGSVTPHYFVLTDSVTLGRRVSAPPPPPPSAPPLRVFITQPKASVTVSGTVWVVLWVEGTSGASNTFTLTADGQQNTSRTTTARGPVSIPWITTQGGTGIPNGTHTLTGTVRDATGNTGTTSITVIVKN